MSEVGTLYVRGYHSPPRLKKGREEIWDYREVKGEKVRICPFPRFRRLYETYFITLFKS